MSPDGHWCSVPGFPGYEVSREGEVRVTRTGRILRHASPSDSGYIRVRLSGRYVRLHRIVLFAFTGPPPSNRHVGAHDNGDKSDNRATNLIWKLPVDNEADKKRHGTAPKGAPKGGNKVDDETLDAIKAALARKESFSAIAKAYGVHRSSVSRYARGLRRTG